MRKIAASLIFVPLIAFAAAGIADAHYDHQQWIFPAYAYCLVFGLIIMLSLFIISLNYKTKTRHISEHISAYLIQHPISAIIFTGILLAIPTGLIGVVLLEIMWIMFIFPFVVLIIAFPIILVDKRFREKKLLSIVWIKWSLLISISAITASLLFIILADCNLLPGTDITYIARPSRSHPEFHSSTHPYDSMKEIWLLPLFLIGEIVIALLIYFGGIMGRYLYRKASYLHQLRQNKKLSRE